MANSIMEPKISEQDQKLLEFAENGGSKLSGVFGRVMDKMGNQIKNKRDQDYLNQIQPAIFNEANELFDKSDEAFRDTPGFDELYGEQLDNITGDIRRNITSGQNSLTRAFMSGGGDISGSGGARFNEMTAIGNDQIGDARTQFQNRYNDFVENMYRFDANRSDNLATVGLNALTGQQSSLKNDINQRRNRELMREQAAQQRRMQAVGNILGTGAALIGA